MKGNDNYIFNSKIKAILFCILFLNIILMVCLIYKYNIQKNNIGRPSTANSSSSEFVFENTKEILSVTLKTEKLSSGEISSEIESFASKFIPYINESVLQEDSKKIDEFYKDNKDYLKQYAGIENEKDFTTICNKLRKVNCNLNELSKASFVENTAEYSNDTFKVNVKLIDKNDNYIIVKVSNNKESGKVYKYEILEE